MTVVAGPPGGGKSSAFPAHLFTRRRVPYFNIDEHIRRTLGSLRAIPPELRVKANQDLRAFCENHLARSESFAYETTLRQDFAIRMARSAHEAGFDTELRFVALGDADMHVDRVKARSHRGGHSAPEDWVRQAYSDSLANLPAALFVFDRAYLYENPDAGLRLQLEIDSRSVVYSSPPLAPWLVRAMASLDAERP